MACKSIVTVSDFNPSRCILCSKSTFQSDDFALVESRGLATLKDLKNYQKKSAKMVPTMNS